MPTEAPNDRPGPGRDPEDPGTEPGFRPVNELERTLLRCVPTGTRATLLRALARATLCVPTTGGDGAPDLPGLPVVESGAVRLPCVTDGEGRHALVYTSYRQMALAFRLPEDATWTEVPGGTLFEKWPADVDAWLNAGGELTLRLDPTDVSTVADIAAGLEVDEAYEIGPDDAFTDFPGPVLPDQVDCAVVLALFGVTEVVEVLRSFRRLEEPRGRTWRVLLVLVDPGAGTGADVARVVAAAVNEASDECCEVHVADVRDDEVYDAVAHLLRVGVPLWRRQGMRVPDNLDGLDEA
ncbi:MAG TPA: SseB family protein [Mycobacteriales bacterium]|nr:SseB family protein [Mycobacteriales bacterium]